jgi:hypothetical protein
MYERKQYSSLPFFIAGGLKIVYDLLLLRSFSQVKPDSERYQQVNTAAEEDEEVDNYNDEPTEESQHHHHHIEMKTLIKS